MSKLTTRVRVMMFAACSSPTTPDPRQKEYATIEPRLTSTNDSTRSNAHTDLVTLCCPHQHPYSTRTSYPFACRRVESILATTNDVRSLEGLLSPWAPECFDNVSVDYLLSAVQRPIFAAHEDLRVKLFDTIAHFQPNKRTAMIVFAEHARPAETSSERAFWAAARVLAGLAEDDLARLQHAMLVHPSARARRLAATALAGAVDLPLDLPGLAGDLEMASRDPDPDGPSIASVALRHLQRTEQAGPAAAAAERFSSVSGIDVLGRRRLTCGIADIDTRLSLFANAPDGLGDPFMKPAARRALAERQRTCAALRQQPANDEKR